MYNDSRGIPQSRILTMMHINMIRTDCIIIAMFSIFRCIVLFHDCDVY